MLPKTNRLAQQFWTDVFVTQPFLVSSFAPNLKYVHQRQQADCSTPYCALLSY